LVSVERNGVSIGVKASINFGFVYFFSQMWKIYDI